MNKDMIDALKLALAQNDKSFDFGAPAAMSAMIAKTEMPAEQKASLAKA